MFGTTNAMTSFSVDDVQKAREFYGGTLGLDVTENTEMDALNIKLGGGGALFVYGKSNHEPATFTVLNFVVDDVEKAVDELNSKGIVTKIYDDDAVPDMPNDEKGIVRGTDSIPSIAWFRDPANNVLSVMQNL